MTAVALTLFSETWDDLVARQFMRPVDRLAQDLLTDDAVDHFLLVEPYRSKPVRMARRSVGMRRAAFPPDRDGQRRTLISPMRLRRDDPSDVSAARAVYARYGRAALERMAAAGAPAATVITCNPMVAAWSGLGAAGPLTYYARDDFSHHPRYSHLWPAYRAAYAEISRSGTPVVAVSQPLLDAVAPSGPGLVLPNGIAAAEWVSSETAPAWFTSLPKPRLVYTGSLDERLDPALVEQASRAVPGGSVVLLGPTELPQHVARLARIPRVHVHASVGRAELAAVVSAADACILPHVVNGLTRAMSPLKLYEYLAAGRPVVSVDLPPVRDVHPSVVLVDPEGFQAGVVAALSGGPLPESERLDLIDRWSWTKRFAELKKLAMRAPAGDPAAR